MKFTTIASLFVLVGLVSCGQSQENSAETAIKGEDQEKGTLVFTCTPPVGVSGNTATVNGVLKIEKQPSQVYLAKGSLDILIIDSAAKILDKKVISVSGIYDRIPASLGSPVKEEYLNLGTTDVKIPFNMVASFYAPNYDIEYKGASYRTACTLKVSL